MDAFAEITQLVLGDGAFELSKGSHSEKDRRKRSLTAGLSAVGAGAGALGLAAAGNEIRRNTKREGLAQGLKGMKALKAGYKTTPRLTRLLLPAEVAGLSGEVMATKILHHDSKKPVIKMNPVGADLSMPGAKKKFKLQPLKRAQKQSAAFAGESFSKSMTWEGEISKIDEDKRQVFGWASIVELDGEPIVDLQGDYIDIDEIEKSAYDYVVKSRKGGEMHRRDGEAPVHVSDMIESFLVTPEKKEKMGLPDSVPTGWWVGYQINDDEAWNLVKSGKRTGFSIHGRGRREDAMV